MYQNINKSYNNNYNDKNKLIFSNETFKKYNSFIFNNYNSNLFNNIKDLYEDDYFFENTKIDYNINSKYFLKKFIEMILNDKKIYTLNNYKTLNIEKTIQITEIFVIVKSVFNLAYNISPVSSILTKYNNLLENIQNYYKIFLSISNIISESIGFINTKKDYKLFIKTNNKNGVIIGILKIIYNYYILIRSSNNYNNLQQKIFI